MALSWKCAIQLPKLALYQPKIRPNGIQHIAIPWVLPSGQYPRAKRPPLKRGRSQATLTKAQTVRGQRRHPHGGQVSRDSLVGIGRNTPLQRAGSREAFSAPSLRFIEAEPKFGPFPTVARARHRSTGIIIPGSAVRGRFDRQLRRLHLQPPQSGKNGAVIPMCRYISSALASSPSRQGTYCEASVFRQHG